MLLRTRGHGSPWLALAFTLTVAAWSSGGAKSPAAQAPVRDIRGDILQAQERRAPADDDVRTLLDAAHLTDPDTQILAVRALGRLERAVLVPALVPLLEASRPAVRAEAANAIGQALYAATSPSAPALQALMRRLGAEDDARVRGAICATLGRLPLTGTSLRDVEEALLRCLSPALTDEQAATVAGAAEGLESLLRSHAREMKPATPIVERLRAIVAARRATSSPSTAADWTRARRLALLALIAVPPGPDVSMLAPLVEGERDDELRRLAVRAAGQGLRTGPASERERRRDLLRHASDDASGRVRYEAIAAYARDVRPLDCRPFLAATRDPNPHVSLLAIETLGQCPPARATADRLATIVGSPAPAGSSWHRAARALVALARVAPQRARGSIGPFTTSATWQVRAYAAQAAAVLRDTRRLRRLARDPSDNVRSEAVAGLVAVEQHRADAVYEAQLEREDYQLIRTAATALKGTLDRARAAAALGDALRRLTAQRRDTSRDPRLAIIERLAEVGSPESVVLLEPLTRDFDPRVAAAAADACSKLSPGRRFEAAPGPPLPTASLSAEAVGRLDGARAIVTLAGGRSFTLALLAWEAPATVSRFARLVRSGYYDGLTFHRVVPNFVIQGGSPGANEYSGDATYWRDEVGLRSNERGTVGLSTRGRDTGDGQFYVNLVDTPRLDHTYTVFASVAQGMDVVDSILEGDVIRSIAIELRGTAPAYDRGHRLQLPVPTHWEANRED